MCGLREMERRRQPREEAFERGASLALRGTAKIPVVNREEVTLVREEWRVVDRWWTDDPVDRRYFEVVLESGRNVCVYRDREAGCWFSQKA